MNWEMFLQKMQEEIRKKLGPDAGVSLLEVTKNNGVQLHTVSIREGDSNVTPAIYLETFYEAYQQGRSMEYLVDSVVALYQKHRIEGPMDMSCLLRYEVMKERIIYRLVNYEKNRDLLGIVPHVRFLDMALIFGCVLQREAFGTVFVLIKNKHLQLWQVEKEQLLEDAVNNTPLLYPADFAPMEDVIADMLEEREELKIQYREVEETERKAGQKTPPLYVLTNRSGWYGASCILYPGLLQKLAAQLGDDLFILPSSVHEVILLPVRAAGGPAELETMVKEVNATEVDPEEVLSDSVYRYSLTRKAIQKIFVKSKTS